jgi:hypothetical protein
MCTTPHLGKGSDNQNDDGAHGIDIMTTALVCDR